MLKLYKGVGWFASLRVDGADPADRLRIVGRSVRFPLPLTLLDAVVGDGDLAILMDGAATEALTAGTYQLQALYTRGNASAIVLTLPSLVVSAEAFAKPDAAHDEPFPVVMKPIVVGEIAASPYIELTINPAGSGGGGSSRAFHHVQAVADTTWTVEHDLGFRPHVSVTDTSGSLVDGDVEHLSSNITQLRFSAAFAGEARFS